MPITIGEHPAYQSSIPVHSKLHELIGYSTQPYIWSAQYFSSIELLITIIPCYLVVLYIIQQYIKQRKAGAYDLRWFIIPYNLSLSLASGILLYGTITQVVARYHVTGSMFDILCDADNQYRYDQYV